MRALQNDPKHSCPPRRAQVSFYGCTAFVCVRTVLVTILPFYAECVCKEFLPEGDVFVDYEESDVGSGYCCYPAPRAPCPLWLHHRSYMLNTPHHRV